MNQSIQDIQSGAVTHHQDHVITLQSLKTRNTRNSGNPTPGILIEMFSIFLFITDYI